MSEEGLTLAGWNNDPSAPFYCFHHNTPPPQSPRSQILLCDQQGPLASLLLTD